MLLAQMLLPSCFPDWEENATKVASGVHGLAFNNTAVGGRDSEGRVHVVYTHNVEEETLIRHVVGDNGAWQDMIMPTIENFKESRDASKPTIAFANGEAYLAWLESGVVGSDEANDSWVRLAHSTDDGYTWSDPVTIDETLSILNETRDSCGNPPDTGDTGSAWTGMNYRTLSLATRVSPAGVSTIPKLDVQDLTDVIAVVAWTNGKDRNAYLREARGTHLATDITTLSDSGRANDVSVDASRDGTIVAAWEQVSATKTTNESGHEGCADEVWSRVKVGSGDWSDPEFEGAGGDPSVRVLDDDEIYLAYQHKKKVHALRSMNGGASFTDVGLDYAGFFVRVDATDRHYAIAWEHTDEGTKENEFKRSGVAVSRSRFTDIHGPYQLPGSAPPAEGCDATTQTDPACSRTLVNVSVESGVIDVFWIHAEPTTNAGDPVGDLYHQAATW